MLTSFNSFESESAFSKALLCDQLEVKASGNPKFKKSVEQTHSQNQLSALVAPTTCDSKCYSPTPHLHRHPRPLTNQHRRKLHNCRQSSLCGKALPRETVFVSSSATLSKQPTGICGLAISTDTTRSGQTTSTKNRFHRHSMAELCSLSRSESATGACLGVHTIDRHDGTWAGDDLRGWSRLTCVTVLVAAAGHRL